MATAKIAISLPAEVLHDVDRAARERGESRSGFIRGLIHAATRARRDADISRRVDAAFAEPGVAQEQRRVAWEMEAAGTDWSDERW